ncbi:hypothetical protein PIB30_086833 [Stylosanthes scabra]|uniref:Uncharacterized protein n=1 Tax=Stylosanthes scabra TaxID=79078 RepID=A0ABU6QSR5_9FABA|nr:hypothetical protein [Stylosanthes scabra]
MAGTALIAIRPPHEPHTVGAESAYSINISVESDREIGKLAYRFQAITAVNGLEYKPSWLSEDNYVWITFEVHRQQMQDRFMEFCAEVLHVGGSSGFRPFVPQTVPSPINVAPPDDVTMTDYNSADDSEYDDESSCHSTEEDEDVPNTPSVRGLRLVLSALLSIPNLSKV